MNAGTQSERETTVNDNARGERGFVSPEVNIYENKDEYLLEAEMPGVNRNGLDVTLEGNVLTIVGRRSDESPEGRVVYRESKPSAFRRVFELDPVIDAANIGAKVEHGLLTLTLPKAERVKPKKILVAD